MFVIFWSYCKIISFWCSWLVVWMQLINPEVEIRMVENTPNDPRQRKPDNTKAKKLLGWEPKIKLRDVLPLMEDDFRARLDIPKKKNWFILMWVQSIQLLMRVESNHSHASPSCPVLPLTFPSENLVSFHWFIIFLLCRFIPIYNRHRKCEFYDFSCSFPMTG